jgi:hypothetical protein
MKTILEVLYLGFVRLIATAFLRVTRAIRPVR